METAVNISQSCNHFTSTMKLHFLTARRDGESCRETLESLLRLLDGEIPFIELIVCWMARSLFGPFLLKYCLLDGEVPFQFLLLEYLFA